MHRTGQGQGEGGKPWSEGEIPDRGSPGISEANVEAKKVRYVKRREGNIMQY